MWLNYSYKPKSFPGPYPIPSEPKVQGHPGAAWDKHLLVVDTADCRAYELIQYDPFLVALTGVHTALGGTAYPLDSTEMPATTTNAPNTPMIGQYIRADEVAAGEVPHVLAFCSNRVSTASSLAGPQERWPARSASGSMPMGSWIRLKARVDPASFPGGARPVVETLRERGAVLTDSCGHSLLPADRELHRVARRPSEGAPEPSGIGLRGRRQLADDGEPGVVPHPLTADPAPYPAAPWRFDVV